MILQNRKGTFLEIFPNMDKDPVVSFFNLKILSRSEAKNGLGKNLLYEGRIVLIIEDTHNLNEV